MYRYFFPFHVFKHYTFILFILLLTNTSTCIKSSPLLRKIDKIMDQVDYIKIHAEYRYNFTHHWSVTTPKKYNKLHIRLSVAVMLSERASSWFLSLQPAQTEAYKDIFVKLHPLAKNISSIIYLKNNCSYKKLQIFENYWRNLSKMSLWKHQNEVVVVKMAVVGITRRNIKRFFHSI